MRALFIGGARSGKSALAQRWAADRSKEVCVVVTGMESDPEMAARIAAHRRDRPQHWRVNEEPKHLGRALRAEAANGRLILVDCLTLWISNCLWPDDTQWAAERTEFLEALRTATTPIVIVTNEVGTGIVPDNAASRIFRDEQGRLNQSVAALCDEVFFVTAGLPLRLKPT